MGRAQGKEKAAIFLDRDGTIIELKDYLRSFKDIVLIPTAVEALKIFKKAGYLLIVTTNQSGVARGYFTEDFVREANAKIADLFSEQGVKIDSFYYCPHHPDYPKEPEKEICDCRKPKTGMIMNAMADFPINLADSWVIGDNISDVEMAINAKIKSAIVKTGYGKKVISNYPKDLKMPDIVADDIYQAAKLITTESGENK